jgi:hypothetical protein
MPEATGFCEPPSCTFSDVELGACGNARWLSRTWTCTGGGDSVSCTQRVSIADRTPPTLPDIPRFAGAECDAVPPPLEPQVTDACDPAPTLAFEEQRADGTCPDRYLLLRKWTATDACRNSTERNQFLFVDDTTSSAVTALLEPASPLPPRSAASPRSACSAPTSRSFLVRCSASDNCDPDPTLSARLLVTHHDVPRKGGPCVTRVDEVEVACDEPVEVRLLAPPCPARPPRSPRSSLSVNSAGVKVVTGEEVVLRVTSVDRCGNVTVEEHDPRREPSPLCEERLADGTCCPALGPPRRKGCKLPVCGLP